MHLFSIHLKFTHLIWKYMKTSPMTENKNLFNFSFMHLKLWNFGVLCAPHYHSCAINYRSEDKIFSAIHSHNAYLMIWLLINILYSLFYNFLHTFLEFSLSVRIYLPVQQMFVFQENITCILSVSMTKQYLKLNY